LKKVKYGGLAVTLRKFARTWICQRRRHLNAGA
jgi:hypothetical protein